LLAKLNDATISAKRDRSGEALCIVQIGAEDLLEEVGADLGGIQPLGDEDEIDRLPVCQQIGNAADTRNGLLISGRGITILAVINL
jgi:hypothetical protein